MNVAILDLIREIENYSFTIIMASKLYGYWDEQADQASGPLQNASVWSSSPTAGFGTGNTDENDCVIDGAFANITYNLTTNFTRTSNTCMTRIFNETFFDTVSQKVVDSCMDIDDYWKMWACLGNTPHTGGHLGVGGTVSKSQNLIHVSIILINALFSFQMEHVSMSAFDPVFFLHHANLDRLWTQWQSRDTKRLKAMGGPRIAPHTLFGEAQPASLGLSAFVPYFGDKGNVTTLNHNMWMAGIVPNITVADAMDVEYEGMCIKYDK